MSGVPTCAMCGCTDDDACQPDSCSWEITGSAGPLCSACVGFLRNVHTIGRIRAILSACAIRGRAQVVVLRAIGRRGRT